MQYRELTDGYYRVSTQRQRDEGQALDRYREDLERLGIPVDRIFFDVESGASSDRAGYNAVLDRVKRGVTKRVVVPCFDRWTRSPLDWERCLKDFQTYGASLEALSGGIVDLSSPEGVYRSRIDAAAAAYVREKNKASATAGWARRRRLLKASLPPFGYVIVDNQYVIDRSPYRGDAELTCYDVARDLVATFLEHGTQRPTCYALIKKYGKGTYKHDFPRDRGKLKAWLQSPITRGHTAYFGNRGKERQIASYNTHEPIISPTEAAQIDRLLEARKLRRVPNLNTPQTAVSGLVWCECGEKCMRRKKRFYCAGIYDKPNLNGCPRVGGLHLDDVEAAIIESICQQAEKISQLVMSASSDPTDPPELIALRNKLLLLGDDPDFADSRNAISLKIQSLELELSAQSQGIGATKDRQEMILSVAKDPGFWLSLPTDKKRAVFLQLVNRVVKDGLEVIEVELRQ